jgi:hypothetical protein
MIVQIELGDYVKTTVAILITILLSNSAFADAGPVVPLTSGQPAPYTGYLFTPEAEQKVRLSNEELKYYKQANDSLVKINDYNKQQVDLLQQKTDLYRTELDKKDKTSYLENVGFFALGVLVTGVWQ